jgi:proline dehydrogenase
VLRRLILAAADSPRVQRFVAKYGMRLGAARFVAGETLDEAVVTLRALNGHGLRTNTTLLGEFVQEAAEAESVVRTYEEVLRRIAAERLQTNVALKLTHLGVTLDEELGYANVERLVGEAARHGNFIRIDMEDSPLVDVTLRIYRRLREAGHDNVGTVLQSYLYRTEDDLESLLPLQPNLRIVKGAYAEPESVAYPKKEDVDAAYRRLVERSIAAGGFTAVATHDEKLIEHALKLDPGPERMELQMLYGVRTQLQLDLVARGQRVLCAAPYGPDWFPYLM